MRTIWMPFHDWSDEMSQPEAWLEGPVDGISAALQPVAHSFVQVQRDLERVVPLVEPHELWVSPGGAASLGFHLQHLAGSTDRLLTYARGEALEEAQMEWLRCEGRIRQGATPMDLMEIVVTQLQQGMTQLRNTPDSALDEARYVGRKRLPATVRGLLYHAGEHATRHTGQVITTARVVRALGGR